MMRLLFLTLLLFSTATHAQLFVLGGSSGSLEGGTGGGGGGGGGAVDSVNGLDGVVVLTTSNVNEGTRLYHTNQRVLDSLLTGFLSAPGVVEATDSLIVAFNKLNGNIGLKQDEIVSPLVDPQDYYYRGDKVFTILDTAAVPENVNLYYTQARFDSALAAKTTTDLAEGLNLYYTQARFDSALAAKTTTDLAEGLNLYYTDARFDSALAAKTTTDLAEGLNLYYTQARFDSAFTAKSTTDLSEGINLYYTDARFDSALAAKTTTDVAEGANLYYTDARADARIALQKGAINGLATLDGAGKIPSSQLPAIAITDVFVVASELDQLALTTTQGDVVIRTDIDKSFIKNDGIAGDMTDFTELVSPGDLITSVNGQTGNVVLTTSEITEGANLYYTQARFDSAFTAKSTTDLSEGTNLYFTEARVLATPITGFVSGAGTLAATDTVLQSIQKLDGNIGSVGSASLAKFPAEVNDNRLVRTDINGDAVQGSLAVLSDAGELSGLTQLSVDNLRLDGNVLSSTNVGGPINLSTNGTGQIFLNATAVTQNIEAVGNVNATGQVNAGTLRMAGNRVSNIEVDENLEITATGTGIINVLVDMQAQDIDAQNVAATTVGATSISLTSFARVEPITALQRDALTPAAGMVVFNSDMGQLQYYSGSAWLSL